MSERIYVFIGLYLFLVFVLFGLRTNIRNSLDTNNDKVYNLQQATRKLQTENIMLEEQIYHEEALTTIAQKARKMGFVPAQYQFAK